MKFFKRDQVALGDGQVNAFTLIELKNWFSIISYSWGEVGDQMRFHSHAFKSIAITLWGSYIEDVMCPSTGGTERVRVKSWLRPRFIPRDHIHRVVGSKGCRTLVITGPWQKTWWEFFPRTRTAKHSWVRYGWGREVLYTQSDMPRRYEFLSDPGYRTEVDV